MSLNTFVATTRDRTGRVATLAGSVALAGGIFTNDLTTATVLGTVAATGTGLATMALGDHPGIVRATARVLYAAPGASLLAILAAERIASGVRWWEVVAVAAWTAGTWALRPARLARRLLGHQVAPELANTAPLAPVQAEETNPGARWWTLNVARDIAPNTRLTDLEAFGREYVRAVIVSTVPGEPVPDISIPRLSARMNVPKDLITITPVPGKGAGFQLLTLGTPPAQALSPEQEWADIAKAVLPGTSLLDVRVYEANKEISA